MIFIITADSISTFVKSMKMYHLLYNSNATPQLNGSSLSLKNCFNSCKKISIYVRNYIHSYNIVYLESWFYYIEYFICKYTDHKYMHTACVLINHLTRIRCSHKPIIELFSIVCTRQGKFLSDTYIRT